MLISYRKNRVHFINIFFQITLLDDCTLLYVFKLDGVFSVYSSVITIFTWFRGLLNIRGSVTHCVTIALYDN